jgi:GTP-binding protein EngB required for normal cell division
MSLIASSIVSCNNVNQKGANSIVKSDSIVYEDYDQKLKPLLTFLRLNQNYSSNGDKKVFLIFTNRCNACVKYTLEEIKADAGSSHKEIILVFNKPDKIMEGTFKNLLKEIPKTILIDTTDFLEKNGVSFGKNLSVDITDSTITKWKFY